jgi:hypothetical protein
MAIKKMRTIGAVLGTAAARLHGARPGPTRSSPPCGWSNVGTVAATYEFAVAGQTCAKGTTLQPAPRTCMSSWGRCSCNPARRSAAWPIAATATIRLVASLVERDAL